MSIQTGIQSIRIHGLGAGEQVSQTQRRWLNSLAGWEERDSEPVDPSTHTPAAALTPERRVYLSVHVYARTSWDRPALHGALFFQTPYGAVDTHVMDYPVCTTLYLDPQNRR